MAAIMAAIIPLFIPHEGCRHACSFCNQRHTRQEAEPITAQQVRDAIRAWLSRLRPERKKMVQVAFYGGSFTALPGKRQRELLEAVQPFLQDGRVHGIRLSTRPDCVDADTVEMLRDLGVHLSELGVQSCDDAVLAEAGRGHSHSDSLQASRLIRAAGLQLGWQIMVGMPGAGFASIRRMAAACIAERPDCIRIYPLLVLRGSRLAEEWRRGVFQPLSLHKAVLYSAYLKKHFDAHGLAIIRMGLQPGPELEKTLLAGPYHPAFGELVRARIMLNQTRRLLHQHRQAWPCALRIAPADLSVFMGLKRSNLQRLEALGLRSRFTLLADPGLPRQSLQLDLSASPTS